MGSLIHPRKRRSVFRHHAVTMLLPVALFAATPARAAEPDAGKLVERLEAGFSCPTSAAASTRDGLRYVGDTKIFRVGIRQSVGGGATAEDKYEIAFNFADLATVRSLGTLVVYTCRQQSGPSCIVRPRAETPSNPYEYNAVACDGRSASDVREASEALMRLNAGVPTAGLPTIWEAPARQDAPAVKEVFWSHNDSTLDLVAQGSVRKFYYRTPSARMEELGVAPGTLLFDGRRLGNQYSGVAYVFNRACGPIAYQVSGVVSGDDRSVVLNGSAPRRNQNCAVVDRRDDVLTFTLQER